MDGEFPRLKCGDQSDGDVGGRGGVRITVQEVEDEIRQLTDSWKTGGGEGASGDGILAKYLSAKAVEGLDRFDRVQLEDVLRVCEAAKSLSDAGRELFAASRKKKTGRRMMRIGCGSICARFDLVWGDVGGGDGGS